MYDDKTMSVFEYDGVCVVSLNDNARLGLDAAPSLEWFTMG